MALCYIFNVHGMNSKRISVKSSSGSYRVVCGAGVLGHAAKEIAWKLNISFKTAVSHRTHLLQKMGVHETASLVRLAVRSGLVA